MDLNSPEEWLSRRSLLRFGAVTAGASALAILADAFGSSAGKASAAVPGTPEPFADSPSQVTLPGGPFDPRAPLAVPPSTVRPIDYRPPVPVPSQPPKHLAGPKPPPEPAWVHTWDSPIRRLDDFVKRSPSTHYAPGAIMLTIDDGPHPYWTPRYLRLLEKYHVQATFCVIGRQVVQQPTLVRAAVTQGHHIANHTYNHPLNLPSLSAARIHSELADTTDAVVRATGFRPRQFRAPGGVWGPDVFREVSNQKMMPLGWDIDPRDWSLPGVTAIRSAMLAARPHDIILCHDGGGDRSETYAALETVIPALLHRGWTFVTLPAPATI